MFFKQKSRVKKLPGQVKEYMRYRFNLPSEYLSLLRCFEQDDKLVSENNKRNISIFSPVRVNERQLSIKTAEDLGQYPEMVIFEGYFDVCDGVYIADCRGPVWGLSANR